MKYESTAQVVFGTTSVAESPVTCNGYMALNKPVEVVKKATLDKLVKKDYRVVQWDGM